MTVFKVGDRVEYFAGTFGYVDEYIGETATVAVTSPGGWTKDAMKVQFDNGDERTFNSKNFRHIDSEASLKPRHEPPQIIGLAGYARSGKNTVAKILEDMGYKPVSFAEPIRKALLALNPILGERAGEPVHLAEAIKWLGWDEIKTSAFGPEVRRLLQRFGNEVGREQWDQNFWVEMLDDVFLKTQTSDAKFVVTDVRYPNEVDDIRGWGGKVYRVERPGVHALNGHPSETALDGVELDGTIRNGTTLLLQSQVERVIGLGPS